MAMIWILCLQMQMPMDMPMETPAAAETAAQIPYETPREMLIPGRPGMAGVSGQDDGIGERRHLMSGVAYLDPNEC